MTKILLGLSLGMALSACGPTGPSVEPEKGSTAEGTNMTIPSFDWRIRSEAELQNIYVRSGGTIDGGDRLGAMVGLDNGKVVVYTTSPRTVNDEVACNLGHEVMHLTYGNYHE